MKTWIVAAASAATLAGCDTGAAGNASDATTPAAAASVPAPATAPGSAAAPAQIAGDGLRVAGATVAFGTPRAAALKAISTGMGGAAEKQGTQDDCGPGPLAFASWKKGLQLYFQNDKFVGWTGAVDLKTAEGIGFGSTRAALDKAYRPMVEQTSLGNEFTTDGGLSGVLESEAKDATVSAIWAGTTCVAR